MPVRDHPIPVYRNSPQVLGHLLLHQEGVVLDPDMWRILHNRMINRKVKYATANKKNLPDSGRLS